MLPLCEARLDLVTWDETLLPLDCTPLDFVTPTWYSFPVPGADFAVHVPFLSPEGAVLLWGS